MSASALIDIEYNSMAPATARRTLWVAMIASFFEFRKRTT